MKNEVPVWEKVNLTLDEAASYFGIGVAKLKELTEVYPMSRTILNFRG